MTGRITGLSQEDLDLAATLTSGQVFRWERDKDGAFYGVMESNQHARLSQSDDYTTLYYEAESETAVRRFLRLGEIDLPARAEEWCSADASFAECWAAYPGIRLLRQDPHECFFSFLCASVAPIARISGMLKAVVQALTPPAPLSRKREEGGVLISETPLYPFTGEGPGVRVFPNLASLASIEESKLRELGLGFRAKRMALASRRLLELPEDYLTRLRTATHEEAKAALITFEGVGEKIADCVCLFSLDKDGAIPVDTHVWRMATTRYAPELAGKSLTAANYAKVVQAFHNYFGPDAGWAQQILFYRAAVGSRQQKKTG